MGLLQQNGFSELGCKVFKRKRLEEVNASLSVFHNR